MSEIDYRKMKMKSRIIEEKEYRYAKLQLQETDLGKGKYTYEVLIKYSNRSLIIIHCIGEKHSAEVFSALTRATNIYVEQEI